MVARPNNIRIFPLTKQKTSVLLGIRSAHGPKPVASILVGMRILRLDSFYDDDR